MNSKTRGQGANSDKKRQGYISVLKRAEDRFEAEQLFHLSHRDLKMHVGHSSTQNPNLDLRKHTC